MSLLDKINANVLETGHYLCENRARQRATGMNHSLIANNPYEPLDPSKVAILSEIRSI